MLGPLMVTAVNQPAVFRTDALRVLLAYLAAHQGVPQRRDTLAGLLSPDRPNKEALTYLRNRLSRLRKVIGDDTAVPSYLHIDRKQITLRTGDDIFIDIVQFENALKAVETHPHRQLAGCPTCLAHLENAASLVRGELLAGLNFPSETWETWLINQREHIQQRALEGMSWLRDAKMTLGEWTAVLDIAQRQLSLEPWQEAAHRAIMQAHAQLGDRNAALAQFEQCQKILWDELGVEPEKETIVLFESQKAEGRGQRSSLILHPSSFQNNLPVQTTRFFGREAEQAQLLERLVDPTYRLITLVGVGGNGKTRLAIEVGRQVKASFPDGAWFVSLDAARGDAEQIKIAIGEAIGLGQMGRQLTGEQVLALLRDKRVLLILDNCEVVLDELDFISEWLKRLPQIAILATSREPLNFQSESIVTLHGLPIGVEPGMAAEAMFAERGQMARIDFALTAENRAQVRQICELVEGSPLGIGLAAAWVNQRSLTQIIEEIGRSLDILSTRWRDVDARHRSVRAVFETSWHLLKPAEQDVLASLSVFPASFTAVAALEIVDANQRDLTLLLDKSLLQQAGSDRYAMHSLLRQFAAEKLSVGKTAVDQMFVDYFYQYARQHQEDYAQLQPEWRNFLTAVQRAHEHESWQDVIHFTQLLDEPWFRQIRLNDMREGLKLGVNAALTLHDQPTLAKLLLRLGEIEIELNDYDMAETHLADALILSLRIQDSLGVAQAKYLIGRIKMEQSLDEQAISLYKDAKQIFEEQSDELGVAKALNLLAVCQIKNNKDFELAKTFLEESATIQQQIPFTIHYIETLRYLARINTRLEKLDKAEMQLIEAENVSQQLEDLGELAAVLYEQLILWKFREQPDKALSVGYQSLEILRKLGSLRWEALVKTQLALLHQSKQAFQEAESLFLDGLQIFNETNDVYEEAFSHYYLYKLYAETGQEAQSLEAKKKGAQLNLEVQNRFLNQQFK